MLGVGRYGPRGRDEDVAVRGRAVGDEPAALGVPGPDDAPRSQHDTADAGSVHIPAPSGGAVDDDERDAWIVLNEVEGVGPVTFGRLVGALGTARAVLAASVARDGSAVLVAAARDPEGGASLLAAVTAGAIASAARDPHAILAPVRRSGVEVL